MRRYNALVLVCHAHSITRIIARLLFEGGSNFFQLAKRAATNILGAANILVNTVLTLTLKSYISVKLQWMIHTR